MAAPPAVAPKYFSLFAKPAPKPSTSEPSEPAAAATPSPPPPAQPDAPAPAPVVSLSSESPARQIAALQSSSGASRPRDGGRAARLSEHAPVELDLSKAESSEDMEVEPAPPARRTRTGKHSAPASAADSDSDEELVFVDLPRRSKAVKKQKQKQKQKEGRKATPVIVIPDSPPPRRSVALGGLKPVEELQRAARERRKAREHVDARWPTREEHGGQPSAAIPARDDDDRWAESSGARKGKGRALAASGPSDVGALSAYLTDCSTLAATTRTGPKLATHALENVSALVPEHPNHPLLNRLTKPLEDVPPSLTSFLRADARQPQDASDSELHRSAQHIWSNRFAPRSSDEVLGSKSGTSARILKEWLEEHTLLGDSELRNPANKKRPRTVVRHATKPKKHKSGGSSDLDDFIAESDEDEGPYGGDSSDTDGGGPSFVPKSQAARETFASRLTNLVLLHGPHGSGKTSTVHAVAGELGWDVFEVYPGLGKRTANAMEKYVGDVARNHMAAGGTGGSPTKAKDAFAMFKKVTSPPSPVKLLPTVATAGGGSRPRQSLILIDEVDVLFNEEKDFWSGLATLVAGSRRPVILTCSDASRVPFEDLALQPVHIANITSYMLDFAPPEAAVAIPFLQLVALSEGHILTHADLRHLYNTESLISAPLILQEGSSQPIPHPWSPPVRPAPDLRRALVQLQFHCQWAIGDSSGGPSSSEETTWSVGTYQAPGAQVDAPGLESHERDRTDTLEAALVKADALSFSDAFVCRRMNTQYQVVEPDHAPPGPNSLAGATLLESLPNLHSQLPESGREPEIASAIASLVGWDEAAGDAEALTIEERRLDCSKTASTLIHPHVVDHPAPVLPQSCITVEYLPSIRLITAADQIQAVVPPTSGEASRGPSRRTRATANVYQPRITWGPGEADSMLQTGFS